MNTKIRIIAIVGMPGSGKSIAAKFFTDKGIPVLRFGDQTDIGLKELGMELNEKNEKWYRENIRKELGMAAMAKKIEPRINAIKDKYKLIILDGLYSWEEYIYLLGKFPKLKLLCIYTKPEIRHYRLSQRQIRPLTSEEAKNRDFAELTNLNKGGPIAIADLLILNNDTLKEFQNILEKLYKSL
jgi:dephospho-CoA kinase